MIKLYENQKHSIYEIQKAIGVAKYTLYRYAKKEINIKSMKPSMLIAIANYEKVEANKLYKEMIEYLGGE